MERSGQRDSAAVGGMAVPLGMIDMVVIRDGV